jgi:uncharacterized protein YndB with AHSA1/START domain
MRWILLAAALLVALVGLATLVGGVLPKNHVVTRTARLRRPPEDVWSVIADFAAGPSWRRGLRAVERLPDRDGHAVWKKVDRRGQALPLEIVEEHPPRRMVARIADDSLPFGGTWTYEVAPASGGSMLTVTERGVVRNPLFRFVARFLIGHTATIDGYLEALSPRFGEPPDIS